MGALGREHSAQSHHSCDPGGRARAESATGRAPTASAGPAAKTPTQVRRLITAIRFPALAIDARNRIVAWNRAADELLGFSKEEVVGRLFEDVFRARDAFGNLYCTSNAPLHAMTSKGDDIHPFTLDMFDANGMLVRVVVSADVVPGGGSAAYYLVLRLWPERRRGSADQLAAALLKRPPLPRSGTAASGIRAPHGEPNGLTLRQREVLSLLAHGKSALEVAEILSISIHTVHNHCRNILERLRVHNQVEAVAVAMRHRLI